MNNAQKTVILVLVTTCIVGAFGIPLGDPKFLPQAFSLEFSFFAHLPGNAQNHHRLGRGGSHGRADLARVDQRLNDVVALALVEKLRAPDQFALREVLLAGAANNLQHPLVVALGVVVGEMPLGLGQQRVDAMGDDIASPCSVRCGSSDRLDRS